MNKIKLPRVSVVIPTYNRKDFVLRAVQSARQQTIQDIEIIVVIDASPDDSAEALLDLDEPRLRLIVLEVNRGAPAARNVGISESQGDYVAFLDDDDIWLPTKLESQLSVIGDHDGVLCAFKYEGKSKSQILNISDVSIKNLRKENPFAGSSLLVRANIVKEVNFDESLSNAQDWDHLMRLVQTYNITYLPKVLFIVCDGEHERITNSALTQTFEELEYRTCATLKHANTLEKYWLNYRLAMHHLGYIASQEDKWKRLVKVVKKYGWMPTSHVIIDKVIKRIS